MTTCPSDHRVIQIIEPDSALATGQSSGGGDPSLDESGSVPLEVGVDTVEVTFQTPKASVNYRFEYLYVDAFGIFNPVDIEPIVQLQTHFGFTVNLVVTPSEPGYFLRWRVIVIEIPSIPDVGAPESIRLPLPVANLFTVFFGNPRESVEYGFSELRVENLADPPAEQSPIHIQVVAKTLSSFTIGVNPSPPTLNYVLVARTP